MNVTARLIYSAANDVTQRILAGQAAEHGALLRWTRGSLRVNFHLTIILLICERRLSVSLLDHHDATIVACQLSAATQVIAKLLVLEVDGLSVGHSGTLV